LRFQNFNNFWIDDTDKLARHPDLYDAPILIVANKCDTGDDHAEDMMSTEEIVRALPMLIPTGVSTLEGVVSATASTINDDVERGFVAARRGNTTRLVQLISVSAKSGFESFFFFFFFFEFASVFAKKIFCSLSSAFLLPDKVCNS
jgi:GTPase SAR1 family protein